MDLHTFNREFTEDFIALYKSLPCLWNTNLKDYLCRKKKNKAYEQLAILQRQVNPNACKDTVVKKINSLRTTYRRERKKVEAQRENNEIYVPNLWYYDMMTFLDEGEENEDDGEYNDNEQYEEEVLDEEFLEEDFKPLSTTITKVKPEPVNSSISSEEHPKKIFKKDASLSSAYNDRNSSMTDEDNVKGSGSGRFTHFGKYIAQELERLPDGMAVFCQKLINDTIFEAQMGALNSKSRIVNNFLTIEQNTFEED